MMPPFPAAAAAAGAWRAAWHDHATSACFTMSAALPCRHAIRRLAGVLTRLQLERKCALLDTTRPGTSCQNCPQCTAAVLAPVGVQAGGGGRIRGGEEATAFFSLTFSGFCFC